MTFEFDPDGGRLVVGHQFRNEGNCQPSLDDDSYESTGESQRMYFNPTRDVLTVHPGVPRVEIHTPGQRLTLTWRNMIGAGVMDMLTIDEPPVISVTTPTDPPPELVEQLMEALERLVEPHIR